MMSSYWRIWLLALHGGQYTAMDKVIKAIQILLSFNIFGERRTANTPYRGCVTDFLLFDSLPLFWVFRALSLTHLLNKSLCSVGKEVCHDSSFVLIIVQLDEKLWQNALDVGKWWAAMNEWLPSLFTVPAVSFSEPNFQDFPEDDGTIILQRSLVSLLRRWCHQCVKMDSARDSVQRENQSFYRPKRFGQIVASCKGLSVLERPEQHSEKPMKIGRPFTCRPKDRCC